MTATLSPQRWANDLTLLLNCVHSASANRFPVQVPDLAKEISRRRFPDDPVSLVAGNTLHGFDGALWKAPAGKKGWGIIYNSAIASPGASTSPSRTSLATIFCIASISRRAFSAHRRI